MGIKNDPAQIAQIISTKLCHDLAGPISAVQNGLEIFNIEEDGNIKSQIMDLLKMSSTESLAKLQMYRMAYGVAHEDINSEVEEMIDITQRFFNLSKISIDWPLDHLGGFDNKINNIDRKILALMILTISCLLIFGGVLTIRKENKKLIVTGKNPKIKNADEVRNIIKNNQNATKISINNVLVHYLMILANQQNIQIECVLEQGKIEIFANN